MSTGVDIAGGIAGLGMNVINRDSQQNHDRSMLDRSNTYTLGLQRDSQAFAEKMYGKQIADQIRYNDPSYIKERLKAAGLNPALMYSGALQGTTGSTAGGGAGGSVGGGANSLPTLDNPVMMGMNMKMMQAQIDLTKAQEDKTRKEGDSIDPESAQRLAGYTADMAEIERTIKDDTKSWVIQASWEAMNKLRWEGALADFDAQFKQTTWNDQVNQVKAESKWTMERIISEQLKQANIDADTKAIRERLDQEWKSLEIHESGSDPEWARIIQNILSGVLMYFGIRGMKGKGVSTTRERTTTRTGNTTRTYDQSYTSQGNH